MNAEKLDNINETCKSALAGGRSYKTHDAGIIRIKIIVPIMRILFKNEVSIWFGINLFSEEYILPSMTHGNPKRIRQGNSCGVYFNVTIPNPFTTITTCSIKEA